MNRLSIILLTILLFFSCGSSETEPQYIEPIFHPSVPVTEYDPINEKNKNKIISYLRNLENDSRTIVGQNIGHADYPTTYLNNYFDEIYTLTGRKPALLGVDLGFGDFSTDFSVLINDLQQHWNENGLITISMHPMNPKTKEDSWDLRILSSDYDALLMEGTDLYKTWRGMLGNIANLLQKLKEKNIIVLWRPLHEMNGGWFWWSNSLNEISQQQFIALWIDMYNFFYVERKLDNLLWVYSPNYKHSEEMKMTDYFYPGDEYIDVVGLDYYGDDLSRMNEYESYDRLAKYDKPMVLGEIGSSKIRDGSFDNLMYLDIKKMYCKFAYFNVWHSYKDNAVAIHDNQNAKELMENQNIITLDEISIQ